jgi:ABC-type nitrate/sulfonate/bicarbonate transport system ATPase subunit
VSTQWTAELSAHLLVQVREKQMAALMKRYLAWEGSVRANLQAHGFWCDSVHPQTGHALYSTKGAKYSEAIGAQVLLQYQVRNEGGCGMIVHPIYGCNVYPVTFFTTAPYVSLLAAMSKVCTLDQNDLSAQWEYAATDASDLPLVSVFGMTIADSSSGDEPPAFVRCSARSINFEVLSGHNIVIHGNPGIGKSTMLSAIRGLTTIHQGGIKWRPGVRAMLVPQVSVVAPEATLSAQVSYPSREWCSHEEAVHALTTVGLGYLVERFEKGATLEDFMTLSKGELQCVGIARVLRAAPHLALLDEALSAVPVKTEVRLLNILTQAGITLLMVSHREEVRQVASAVLTLDASLPDGWKLEHIN